MIYGQTNFIIKSKLELDLENQKNNNLIIIFGHPLCLECQKIMSTIPYLIIKFFIKNTCIKFCNIKENKEIADFYWIKTSPTLTIFKNWKLVKITSDFKEIKKGLY